MKKKILFVIFIFFTLVLTNILIIASIERILISEDFHGIPQRIYREDELLLISDSLNTEIGVNKVFIEEFRLQSLIALSFYPELRNVEIHFKYSNEATTMACRPDLLSLIKGRRIYYILINNRKNFEGILLVDVPFNAQIGVIGHEIAHILDYEGRNILGIIKVGLDYLHNDSKSQFEQYVDKMTIFRGLGWQLYDWAQYSMYDSPKATEEYKMFKRDIYLQPQQIITTMDIYSCYQILCNK